MPAITIRQLVPGDAGLFRGLLAMLGEAFNELDTYTGKQPDTAYLENLLQGNYVIPVVALAGDEVVAGLVAYALPKFEQNRSEIHIYDLATDVRYRRQGIATALIEKVREIAVERGAWTIFVQADYGDDPAIALYSRLGRREEILHFDIPPARPIAAPGQADS